MRSYIEWTEQNQIESQCICHIIAISLIATDLLTIIHQCDTILTS
jgi:hypothetical protein